MTRIHLHGRYQMVFPAKSTARYPLTKLKDRFIKSIHFLKRKIGGFICFMIIGGRVAADMMAQVEEVHLKFPLYVALTLHSQQTFNLGKDTCLFPRFADGRYIGRFKRTI